MLDHLTSHRSSSSPVARQLAMAGWRDICAGKIDDAASKIGIAVQMEPLDAGYRCLMGDVHLLATRVMEAKESFEAALRSDPDYAKARSGLWQARMLLGEDCDDEMAASGCTQPVWFRLRGPGDALALTIDDGPTPAATPAILEILAHHHVRATFFMVGIRAEANPDLVGQVVAAGHQIAVHGWSHQISTALPPEALAAEMVRTEAVLSRFRATPERPWVRLPYGLGWDAPSTHAALRQWHAGCRLAQWGPTFSEWLVADACRESDSSFDKACADAVDATMANTRMLENGIVLAHDDMIGVEGNTAHLAGPRTLDGFIAAATAAGYRVGPLPP